ncbi:MAG: RNA polymerase sigma factor [Cytophagales bacterium]|nr:RNA polymerase sigma factor [Cytophagales bacterium]
MKAALTYKKVHDAPQAAVIDLKQKSDTEIWDLFRQGHEGAFIFIYLKYIQDLHRYGLRFCQDREIIKDCIQELFLDLRRSKNLKSTDAIKPYLFAAMRLKVLGILKKNQRISEIISTGARHEFNFEVSHETKIINSQIEKEQKEKLRLALSKLTTREKELLHYFYVENFSYQQMAKIMRFSNVKSARNIIYKTMKKLRKLIFLQ